MLGVSKIGDSVSLRLANFLRLFVIKDLVTW